MAVNCGECIWHCWALLQSACAWLATHLKSTQHLLPQATTYVAASRLRVVQHLLRQRHFHASCLSLCTATAAVLAGLAGATRAQLTVVLLGCWSKAAGAACGSAVADTQPGVKSVQHTRHVHSATPECVLVSQKPKGRRHGCCRKCGGQV
jgi:hypothetical protein